MVRALVASIIATAIVSAMIYVNMRIEVVPDVDVLAEIAAFNERLGFASTGEATWITHVIIGVLFWGVIYAAVSPILPGRGAPEGILFGVIAWLAMMVSFMPLAGREVFAQDLGPTFIAATLAMHLVYGAVLGISAAALDETDA